MVVIKPIKIAEHYGMIAAMMYHLHANEHTLHSRTAPWEEIEAGYMKHIISMQEECEGLCLVAYVQNVAAGFIFGYLEEQDDSRIEIYKGKELYVSDGYIAEQYRRQGLYRKLNEHLEAHYIAQGVKRITRFTLVNNTRMRRFLDNEGYGVTRVLYEKWL